MKCLRANNPGERDRYYDKAALASKEATAIIGGTLTVEDMDADS